jgi:hypothetical protein
MIMHMTRFQCQRLALQQGSHHDKYDVSSKSQTPSTFSPSSSQETLLELASHHLDDPSTWIFKVC